MLPEYVKYYFLKLTKPRQQVYLQMYDGFRTRKPIVEIACDSRQISVDDLMYIFRCLYNDTPSFYYLQVAGIHSIWTTPTGYLFKVNYQYTEAQIAQFDKLLNEGLVRFKDRYIRDDMSDYEKELAIHDFLVATVTYDHASITSQSEKLRHGEIFNVLGPLVRQEAVCWGIACAFKLLCDYCHVKCFVIIGRALDNSPDAEGHAWNIVRLDDENYHVDVTWDLKERGDISCVYDNLNLTDALIRLDHTWDDTIYPPCGCLDYNYFRMKRFYVKRLEQVRPFIKARLDEGVNYIAFKYVDKDMPSEEDMKRAVIAAVRRGGYQGSFNLLANRKTHNVYIDLLDKQWSNRGLIRKLKNWVRRRKQAKDAGKGKTG